VRETIQRRFGVRYSEVHVWRLLGKLGFSSQRPEKQAKERDEVAIARWKKRTWPALKKVPSRGPADRLCRRIGAVGTAHPGAHLAPIGQTRDPVSLQLEAAVGDRRADLHPLRLPAAPGASRSPQIVEFLRALRRHLKRRLLIVWDGLRAHRSRLVRDYVDSTDGGIQLAFLPPYARS